MRSFHDKSNDERDGDGIDSVVRSVVLPVSRPEAWRLVADESELAAWLGDGVELDLAPGGALRVEDGDVVRTGTVTEIAEGHRLGFTWAPVDPDGESLRSTVTIDVAEDDDGARVTVTETRAAAGSVARASDAGAWDGRLVDLELAALTSVPAFAGTASATWI